MVVRTHSQKVHVGVCCVDRLENKYASLGEMSQAAEVDKLQMALRQVEEHQHELATVIK